MKDNSPVIEDTTN